GRRARGAQLNGASRPSLHEAVERLARERPIFHTLDTEGTWTVLPDTLRMISRHVEPGARSLEIGCGASTVVFTAGGMRHTAVSSDPLEHKRIREYCERVGIDHSQLELIDARS